MIRWSDRWWSTLSNATSLVATAGANAAVGYLYWGVAARGFAATDVGVAATSLSATVLLGTAATLGLGTLLVGELPRQSTRALSLIAPALAVAFLAGLLFGAGFATLGAAVSSDLQVLRASIANVILVAVAVGLSAMTLVLDQALIGMLRGGLQFWRNLLFAIVKLGVLIALLLWTADRSAVALYTTWVVGQAVSLAAMYAWLTATARHLGRLDFAWAELSGSLRSALGHHALNVGLQAPSLVLPLVVTLVLSAGVTAYFYTAWMVVGLVFVGPMALTTVLFAIGSQAPARISSAARMTAIASALGGLVACVCLFVAAPTVMGLFGPAYAMEGTQTLRLAAFAVFPLSIKDHYVTLQRLQGNMARTTAWIAGGCVLELGCAAIGGMIAGLPGVALGYTLGVCLEAACMLPEVARTVVYGHASRPWLTKGFGSV